MTKAIRIKEKSSGIYEVKIQKGLFRTRVHVIKYTVSTGIQLCEDGATPSEADQAVVTDALIKEGIIQA